ncbi:pro-resilin-like [Atheta coriaria]|uniref:pro-resilin-like n=1 Tax=Dalotia coriaria TaxID=877792 RepID=UPI0031F4797F
MFDKGLIIVLICTSVLCEDKKWVWEKNSRNAKLRDADDLKGSPRYEIFEPEGGDFDYDRPQRPHQNYPGNRPNYRPPFGGPGPQRPPFGGNLGGPGGYYPNQNVDPGFNGLGGRPPFKRFDTCSCTEKFNCQSPGLSYGHCDVGKSYCCYNKHGQVDIGPSPSRPIQSPANGVLVGPSNGGDIGYGQYGGRPDYDRLDYNRPNYRPGYNSRPGRPQGVLVGPGGPTGIIGRPGGVRPLYGSSNGVLVGPGGPYDRPYGGQGGFNRPPAGIGLFGRSAQNDSEDDEKNSKKDKRDV